MFPPQKTILFFFFINICLHITFVKTPSLHWIALALIVSRKPVITSVGEMLRLLIQESQFELLALFFNYTHEVMMICKRQKFTIAFLFWVARYSVSLMMILAILKNLFFVIIKSFSGQLPFVLFKLKFFLLHGKLMDVRNKISHFPYRLMIILKTCCKNKARWIGYAIKTHIIIALKAIS